MLFDNLVVESGIARESFFGATCTGSIPRALSNDPGIDRKVDGWIVSESQGKFVA